MDEIADSIVIGKDWKNDVRIVLFVKPAADFELTDQLWAKIATKIQTGASPRHVPAKIVAVPDIPYTLNIKKVELAVRKAAHNQPVTKNTQWPIPKRLPILKIFRNFKNSHPAISVCEQSLDRCVQFEKRGINSFKNGCLINVSGQSD